MLYYMVIIKRISEFVKFLNSVYVLFFGVRKFDFGLFAIL